MPPIVMWTTQLKMDSSSSSSSMSGLDFGAGGLTLLGEQKHWTLGRGVGLPPDLASVVISIMRDEGRAIVVARGSCTG